MSKNSYQVMEDNYPNYLTQPYRLAAFINEELVPIIKDYMDDALKSYYEKMREELDDDVKQTIIKSYDFIINDAKEIDDLDDYFNKYTLFINKQTDDRYRIYWNHIFFLANYYRDKKDCRFIKPYKDVPNEIKSNGNKFKNLISTLREARNTIHKSNSEIDNVRLDPLTIQSYLLTAARMCEVIGHSQGKKKLERDFDLNGAYLHTNIAQKHDNIPHNPFEEYKAEAGNNPRSAMAFLRESADDGCAEAAYHLGCIYRALSKDGYEDEAWKWIEKAAEQGLPEAQYDLSYHYQDMLPNDIHLDSKNNAYVTNPEYDSYIDSCFKNATDRDEDNGIVLNVAKYFTSTLNDNIPQEYILLNPSDERKQHIDKAFEWMLKAAKQGYSEAQYSLSQMYEDYYQGDKAEDAFRWMKRASESDDENVRIEALHCLILMYQEGQGTEESYKDAFKTAETLSKTGDTRAAFIISEFYYKGKGTNQSEEKAYNCFKDGCKADLHPLTIIQYLVRILGDENKSKIFEWIKKLAIDGVPNAAYLLGQSYVRGDGTNKDSAEAFRWLTESSLRGEVYSFYHLGILYCNGTGCNKDDVLGFLMFKRAAKGKYARWGAFNNYDSTPAYAANQLSYMCRNGIGTDQDDGEAFKWALKAANAGLTIAQYTVALFFIKGIGTNQDYNEAFRWMKSSAESGLKEAQYTLALMYKDGIGTDQNVEKAFKWAGKAALANNADAQNLLSLMYQDGIGTQKSPKKAVEWATKAVKNGYRKST